MREIGQSAAHLWPRSRHDGDTASPRTEDTIFEALQLTRPKPGFAVAREPVWNTTERPDGQTQGVLCYRSMGLKA